MASPTINASFSLGTFDGTIDFAGSSGTYLAGLTASQTTTSQPDAYNNNLSAFIGTGTIALPISADSPSTLTGPADLGAELLTDAGATFEISYTYVPASTSPPASTVTALTISGTQAGQLVTEQTTLAPFANVVITDPNVVAGNPNTVQTETVTVTLSAPANGTLSNLGAGSYDAATGVYTVGGTAPVVSAALRSLVFTPTPNEVAPGQSVTTDFTISDTDLSGATATDTATSVITTAGVAIDTAAAAGEITAELGSLAVAPTITGSQAGQAVTDETAIAPFTKVTITDLNIAQTDTVTVTLSAATNGTLSKLGGGSYDASTGVYTDTGSAAAVTRAVDGLLFVPTAREVAPGHTVTTEFTIGVTDSAAKSVTDTTTTVITTAGTVAPTITDTVADQAVANPGTITPFSGVTIGDANAGQTETLTVTLSAAANGTLSNLGGGSYSAATGVYTDTGSAAAVTAALDGLVFVPTAGEVAAGRTIVTKFTISDIDTAGASATDGATSVVATSAPAVSTEFATTDTTSGLASTVAGALYVGPVAGLQLEYITTTTDNLSIAATAPNVFIHTGAGDDAINVSQAGGTNVLDGSTGSNFLVGGSGDDTFCVDDRALASAIWNTVAKFHSGDAATIFGVTPTDFELSWVDGQGATGYTGLTLHAAAPGAPMASLTLAGFTSADLTNGGLSISYGTEAASGGLAGSTYMYIHAN